MIHSNEDRSEYEEKHSLPAATKESGDRQNSFFQKDVKAF